MRGKSAEKPSAVQILFVENNIATVRLTRNVTSYIINHPDNSKQDMFEYEEIEVKIVDRDGLSDYLTANIDVYFEIDLQKEKDKKIQHLKNQYNQELISGVNVKIGKKQYSFSCTKDDILKIDGIQKSIDKSFLSYPVFYLDCKDNTVVVSNQQTLNIISESILKFSNTQHQQLLSLIDKVQKSNSTSDVDAVSWVAGKYE